MLFSDELCVRDFMLRTPSIINTIIYLLNEYEIGYNCSLVTPSPSMILAHRGSGSGGYLDYVFRSAAKELFNIDINDEPLEFKVTKYENSIFLYRIRFLLFLSSLKKCRFS